MCITKTVKRRTLTTIVKIAGLCAWLIGLSLLIVSYLYPFLLNISPNLQYLGQVIVYIVMVIPVIILHKSDKLSSDSIGLSFKKLWLQLLLGIGLAAVIYGLYFILFARIIQVYIRVTPHSVLCYTLIQFVVGAGEEYVFRGYIQAKLKPLFGKYRWIAPFIQAILFALWHFRSSVPMMLYIFFIGLVFGFVIEYSKNAKLPCLAVAHGSFNSLIVLAPMLLTFR